MRERELVGSGRVQHNGAEDIHTTRLGWWRRPAAPTDPRPHRLQDLGLQDEDQKDDEALQEDDKS